MFVDTNMINYYNICILLADGDSNLHSCVSCNAFMYVCCINQSYWEFDIHDTYNCTCTISKLLYMHVSGSSKIQILMIFTESRANSFSCTRQL